MQCNVGWPWLVGKHCTLPLIAWDRPSQLYLLSLSKLGTLIYTNATIVPLSPIAAATIFYCQTNDLAVWKHSNRASCPIKSQARTLCPCCTLIRLHVSCLGHSSCGFGPMILLSKSASMGLHTLSNCMQGFCILVALSWDFISHVSQSLKSWTL